MTNCIALCYHETMFHARDTLKINQKNHLEIGGVDCVSLAEQFGTPLYVFDEAYIRNMMRVYQDTINEEYEGNGLVLYASKAFSCQAVYAIAQEEKIGVDVVSGGELFTALQSGFPADKIYMHGNNKLPYEMKEGLDARIAAFVVDAYSEADFLDEEAQKRNMTQDVLIRINPGVEAHTHAYVQTATPDSKFGFSVSDGAAMQIAKHILSKKHLHLKGFHCHIGSQIFEKQSFTLAVKKMCAFLFEVKTQLGFETETLNMGGGFGIWYSEGDPMFDRNGYKGYLQTIITTLKEQCNQYSLNHPYLLIEPGRSIVGEAGITLYRIGAIKEIPGIRKYLAVDGGMFDNPRYCLYQSKYTAILANRAEDPPQEIVAIAGKCCESGDLIGTEFNLSKANTGDLLAVLSTGAYNYSMASNYNRNLIPPVVLVNGGKAEYIVRPQTYRDLIRNDAIPTYLRNKK